MKWIKIELILRRRKNNINFLLMKTHSPSLFFISISIIIKIEDVFADTLVRHPFMSRFLSSFDFGNTYPYMSLILNSFAFENTGGVV